MGHSSDLSLLGSGDKAEAINFSVGGRQFLEDLHISDIHWHSWTVSSVDRMNKQINEYGSHPASQSRH